MPPLPGKKSYTDIKFTLRQQFRKDDFRPQQKEIIEAALASFDVYVQAATSFGKSLCFQLPAVVDEGITVVVSPLLSLMSNQVNALRSHGVNAAALNGTISYDERRTILLDLETGHPRTKLLYVTPEMCSTASFRERLQSVYSQKELARVVVDEAHCISEWGHDFRKDFKRLSWFRESFPDVPIMCLTATANSRVRKDILEVMRLDASPEKLKTFIMSAQRRNLHLEIKYTTDEDDNRLTDFVRWINGVYDRRRAEPRKSELLMDGERLENVSGIIYTISRGECEYLASALRKVGIGAQPYHARLDPEVKEKTLSRWVNNEPGFDVIVATTAFGMGIDKDDVRFVVHWRLPKSFEGYYQEIGRAGRDGNASFCFLYYSREDSERVIRMVSNDMGSIKAGSDGANRLARRESLKALVQYCEDTRTCRHTAICRYFDEAADIDCDLACDYHKDRDNLELRYRRGLASEEWVSTQAMQGSYDYGYQSGEDL